MTLELIPLCAVDITLEAPLVVGNGPNGLRVVYGVTSMRLSGDRINASMKGMAAADWLNVVDGVGTLDVRATVETDDGALIYVTYSGRTNAEVPGSPIYVAPKFETGHDNYKWLNAMQAAGKGMTTGTDLHYDWFELQ